MLRWSVLLPQKRRRPGTRQVQNTTTEWNGMNGLEWTDRKGGGGGGGGEWNGMDGRNGWKWNGLMDKWTEWNGWNGHRMEWTRMRRPSARSNRASQPSPKGLPVSVSRCSVKALRTVMRSFMVSALSMMLLFGARASDASFSRSGYNEFAEPTRLQSQQHYVVEQHHPRQ